MAAQNAIRMSFQPAASYGLVGTGALASDFSEALVMRENMSTGTGNTKVVFFSTPISVNVCR